MLDYNYTKRTIIKKTKVSHDCYSNHVIPAGQKCYKYSCLDISWYSLYHCEFCKTVLEILHKINNREFVNTETIYTVLEHYFDIYINPKNIDLVSKTVSYFTYNEEESFTISFDEFYKIIKNVNL